MSSMNEIIKTNTEKKRNNKGYHLYLQMANMNVSIVIGLSLIFFFCHLLFVFDNIQSR